eukprot:CAMPEP_0119259774 /NCGR_PEP_ID=MMETSP1329-20130426/458_1 /TAXON_ID=114041 /ORGANISM="Genus nov. species nov., Strain RCC1024" /LENGTH=215 /DNA_ID=CAMNT_0007259175 /DNA_START=67 /DNA_END=714 /DNA_ORIENTATION=+
MVKTVVALALLAPAAGLVAPVAPSRTTQLRGAGSDYAKTLYGAGRGPVGFWDPLNYADLGSEATVDFFRAAEVKHGRIAMMGCLGYFHHLAGITLPGYLSPTERVTFAQLSEMTPAKAWLAVPTAGVQQIFGACAAVEIYSMTHDSNGDFKGGDYWFKGGLSPDLGFDPLGFKSASAEDVLTYKERELANGRLAMIGIMGFVAADQIPGCVPALA